jgi:hypothetical protein
VEARLAKKPGPISRSRGEPITSDDLLEIDRVLREYGLVGDIVFDPPLPPDELRRRYGFGIPIEERIEQARRQIAEGEDLW